MRVKPDPADCAVWPVSPPNWKSRSSATDVETPVLQGWDPRQLMLACRTGREGLGSNGFWRLAPDTPNATTPYQVSPVVVVTTEMLSPDRGDAAMANQV